MVQGGKPGGNHSQQDWSSGDQERLYQDFVLSIANRLTFPSIEPCRQHFKSKPSLTKIYGSERWMARLEGSCTALPVHIFSSYLETYSRLHIANNFSSCHVSYERQRDMNLAAQLSFPLGWGVGVGGQGCVCDATHANTLIRALQHLFCVCLLNRSKASQVFFFLLCHLLDRLKAL